MGTYILELIVRAIALRWSALRASDRFSWLVS